MTIFIRGKQGQVRRPPTIEGMDEEEFLRQNADPIWLKQHGYYELLHEMETKEAEENTDGLFPKKRNGKDPTEEDIDIPF